MKLTVLTENHVPPSSNLLAEHGLSFYIETENLKLIMDLGNTDVFLKNSEKLKIDLSNIDYLVFSHNHYDHTCGLKYWIEKFGKNKKIRLIAHDYAFYRRIDSYNGCGLIDNDVEKYFSVQKTIIPLELDENLIFLGQIEDSVNFEKRKIWGKLELPSKNIEDDFLLDDSALIYRSEKGIVVITGCSHSGICNIISYAKKVSSKKWNMSDIYAVIGGMHLIKSEESHLSNVISFLKKQNIYALYPCHCTDFYAKAAFANHGLHVNEVGVGNCIEF